MISGTIVYSNNLQRKNISTWFWKIDYWTRVKALDKHKVIDKYWKYTQFAKDVLSSFWSVHNTHHYAFII